MKKILSLVLCSFLAVFFSFSTFAFDFDFSDEDIETIRNKFLDESFLREVCGDKLTSDSLILYGHVGTERSSTIVGYFMEVICDDDIIVDFSEDPEDDKFKYWNDYLHRTHDDVDISGVVKFSSKSGSPITIKKFILSWYGGDSVSVSFSTDIASSSFYYFKSEQTFDYFLNDIIANVNRFNNPPDVFTYSVDRNNFKLENNKSVVVNIKYNDIYVKWLNDLNKLYPNVSGQYNFVVYVSSVKPVDSESLMSSMNKSVYTKLQYGNYVYEGGIGYPELNKNPNDSNAESSASGKSPYTMAQGVHIVTTFHPNDSPDHSMNVPILLNNIKGFDDHTPIYICVLGYYNMGNISPNGFNMYNIERDLTGHSTPNDTYSAFYDEYADFENDPDPIYEFHTYYFPFECVDKCTGDGFQGDCVYKPQSFGGQNYDTNVPVSDLTNKALTPDRVHDVDMETDTWVDYDDYGKWKDDFYNNNKYDSNFAFDFHTLDDIFDHESSFFKFISSSLSIFPSYVINIFVAFLVAFLVVVLLKFIL